MALANASGNSERGAIRLELRKGPASWIIGAVIFGIIVATGAYVWVTQPQYRGDTLIYIPIFIAVLVLMMWKFMYLLPESGSVRVRRWGLYSRTLQLSALQRCAIASNHNNSAMLGLKADGMAMYIQLLHVSDVVKESLAPQRLTALDAAMERFAPPVADRDECIGLIRAQAAHLEAGGTPAGSPLAVYCEDALVTGAGTASGGVSIFTLMG